MSKQNYHHLICSERNIFRAIFNTIVESVPTMNLSKKTFPTYPKMAFLTLTSHKFSQNYELIITLGILTEKYPVLLY